MGAGREDATCTETAPRLPCWGPGRNTTRNPRFSFRFPGSFRFRFAARAFRAVPFQLPPRRTRASPVAPLLAAVGEVVLKATELAADVVELTRGMQELLLVEVAELVGEADANPEH